MTKFVAYYRVSTQRQGQSGLGLEAQRATVQAHCGGGELIAEFTEVESGAAKYRPNLDNALAMCKREGATLVIAKLDRLARNLHFISSLMVEGVEFVACDMPVANRLTIHILAAVAEDERRRISERTKAAFAIAKAQGRRLGSKNPAIAAARAGEVATDKANALAIRLRPEIERCQKAGFKTFREIAECLSARGVKTSRGHAEWSASSVRLTMIRAGMVSAPQSFNRGGDAATRIDTRSC